MGLKVLKTFFLKGMLALCLIMGFNSPGCEAIKGSDDRAELTRNLAPGEGLDPGARATFFFSLAQLELLQGEIAQARQYMEETLRTDPNSSFLHIKYAEILINEGNVKDAVKVAGKAIELDPENIAAYNFLADIYIYLHHPDKAEQVLLSALKIAPEDMRTTMKLSEAYFAQGFHGPCVVTLREYLKRHPDSFEVSYRLAQTLTRLQRWADAEKEYRRILDSRPGLYPVLSELAKLYLLSQQQDKAISTYKLILGYYPEDVNTRSVLANILLEEKKNEEAIQVLSSGKRVSPDYPDWWLLSGYVYLQEDKLNEAEREYHELLELKPGNGDAIFYLGLVAQLSGRKHEAVSWFKQVPDNAGGYMESVHRLAWLYVDDKKLEDARRLLELAIEVRTNVPLLYMDLAAVYQQDEQWDKAMAALEQGLNYNPDNEDLLYQKGVIYELSGDREQSLDYMEKLLEKDSNNAKVLNFIGYTWVDEGINMEDAENYIRRALEQEPESGFIIDSMGWLYFKRGDYQEALNWLNRAEEKMPEDPEITNHLGDTYRELKDYQKALEYYRKALQFNPPGRIEKEIRAKIEELE